MLAERYGAGAGCGGRGAAGWGRRARSVVGASGAWRPRRRPAWVRRRRAAGLPARLVAARGAAWLERGQGPVQTRGGPDGDGHSGAGAGRGRGVRVGSVCARASGGAVRRAGAAVGMVVRPECAGASPGATATAGGARREAGGGGARVTREVKEPHGAARQLLADLERRAQRRDEVESNWVWAAGLGLEERLVWG